MKRKQFNVMLTPAEQEQLSQLAQFVSQTKAMVLRSALRAAYHDIVTTQKCCGNGTACIVAHLRAQQPA